MSKRRPLQYDPEQMREIGDQTIDALVDEITAREHQPVMIRASASEIRQRVDGPPPKLGALVQDVLEHRAVRRPGGLWSACGAREDPFNDETGG